MSDNVLSAIETLLTNIQAAREQLADELREASLTDIQKAQQLFQLIERMETFSRDVAAWRQHWTQLNRSDDSETDLSPDYDEIDEHIAEEMFGKRPSATKPPRIKRGQCTPQKAYRIPILEALCELDGAARRKDVLSAVFNIMKERLRPEDKEKVPSSRAIRWENLASFERKEMVQEGLLADNTPGIWQITNAGRAYLERMRDGGGDE